MRRLRDWRTLLALITLAGLALRLLAWRWSVLRPLGGDEQEYFRLALAIARREGYSDMEFMRPPLFPLGMAVLAALTDSSVQALRLVNSLLSTLTVPALFWWTRLLWPEQGRRVALLAAALGALSYTLALNATELLTETVTLLGLTLALGLLARAGYATARWPRAAAAGAVLALVCLVRSVPLPLVLFGSIWLWQRAAGPQSGRRALALLGAALLVLAPWTVRNALVHHSFILIDTTAQENLWLDNDPQGRPAVKAALIALGDDRGARAALATREGLAAIQANPAWFVAKLGHEFQHFWALEHADDMLQRPAIWVPPLEVWLRLLLGDGWWLLLVLLGTVGLVLAPLPPGWRPLLSLWALVVVATAALFHVEFRYRLPLAPALIPLAAWALERLAHSRRGLLLRLRSAGWRPLLALALAGGIVALTLTWGSYLTQASRLASKHLALWRAERAMASASPVGFSNLQDVGSAVPVFAAQSLAARALQLDPRSVLARTLLARADLLLHQPDRAENILREAIALLPAHPYAHLLLGDLLRSQGELAAARAELQPFEWASREDLQRWSRTRLQQTPAAATLDLGGGLDLGFIAGWYAADADARWFASSATVELLIPAAATTLQLRVAAPRPAGMAPPVLTIFVAGQPLLSRPISADWQELSVPLPELPQVVTITLQSSSTYVPHASDRANPDGRALGIQVDWLRVMP